MQPISPVTWTSYKLTNYKPGYSDDCDYDLLLYIDVVTVTITSHSDVYGLSFKFKFSTVSSFFDFWSLGDTLSRVFPYKLNGTYFMTASRTFPVP